MAKVNAAKAKWTGPVDSRSKRFHCKILSLTGSQCSGKTFRHVLVIPATGTGGGGGRGGLARERLKADAGSWGCGSTATSYLTPAPHRHAQLPPCARAFGVMRPLSVLLWGDSAWGRAGGTYVKRGRARARAVSCERRQDVRVWASWAGDGSGPLRPAAGPHIPMGTAACAARAFR